GFRTVFNILGPLANPANASAQVMGVGDEKLMDIVIEALKLLEIKHAMVVHSDGLDEISTFGITKIAELKDGQITKKELNCEDMGISPANIEDLKAADAQNSAVLIKDIISGKETGSRKDIVVVNAAAAIIVGGLAEDFESAIKLAERSISDGKAQACLEKLVEISNS
ncbi:MAG: anthranilate phosphoribosyltransferase, partial [Planctomycetota bacterium]